MPFFEVLLVKKLQESTNGFSDFTLLIALQMVLSEKLLEKERTTRLC